MELHSSSFTKRSISKISGITSLFSSRMIETTVLFALSELSCAQACKGNISFQVNSQDELVIGIKQGFGTSGVKETAIKSGGKVNIK